MGILILKAMRLYQVIISPFFGRNCRFYPSCSEYTIEAVKKYGALKGFLKGVARILKCGPWFKGGIDLS